MTAAPAPFPYMFRAEQNVLGAILTDNSLYGRVGGMLRPEHFSDPLHARIYEVASGQIVAGRVATPITISPALGDAPISEGVKVSDYLTHLCIDTASLIDVPEQAEMLRDAWAMRRLSALGAVLSHPAENFPRERLSAAFEEIDQIRADLTNAKSRRVAVGNVGNEILERIARVRSGEKVDVFTPTGFADIDKIMNGGWYGGDLIILAGRPGMGKTVMACAAAVEAARRGAGVLCFSMEISSIQTASRMMAHRAYSRTSNLSFGRINAARDINDDELRRLEQVASKMGDLPIAIDDSSRLTVSQIAQRAKVEKERLAKQGIPLGLVVVDYLKFVKASDRYSGQRVYEVGEISAGLKELAKDLNVSVLLCAQLNRGIEAEKDKRPDLAHLRESGDLEADADAVLFLYREHYYLSRSSEFRSGDPEVTNRAIDCEHDLELIVAKNRKGQTGVVKLYCDIGHSHVSQAIEFGGYR